MAIRYESPAIADLQRRLRAAENQLKQHTALIGGALQIGLQQRPGVVGAPLAGGKPLWDTFGLIQTLQLAASINAINGSTTSATFHTIASTTLTVPTGRTQNFLALMTIVGQLEGNPPVNPPGGAGVADFRLQVAGQSSNTLALFWDGVGNATAATTITGFVAAIGVTAGTYTVAAQALANTGTALITDGTVNVFLLGG